MNTTQFLNTFDAILNNRNNDRVIIMSLLIYLYFSTLLTRHLLPLISLRVSLLPTYRQQQLAVTIPMLILRCGVALVVAESEFTHRYHPPGTPKPIQLLDHQASLIFLLTLGYIFELLLRPSPLDLDLHHLAVVVAQFYYFHHRATKPVDEHLAVFQIIIILVIYGIGPVDFASENIRLIYYAAPPNVLSLAGIYALTVLGWAGRFVQWGVMGRYVWDGNLSGGLGWREGAVWVAFLGFWVYCEVVEVVHFLRLGEKYRKRVRKMGSRGVFKS
jgi:hypothetical protein